MVVPEIREIGEEDFKRFVPIGVRAEISVPLVKTSNGAILGCNIDGFLPMFNYADTNYMNLLRNMFPVYPTQNAIPFVKIFWDQIDVPIQTHYRCHRAFSGNVNVGLRISSNTTQTGNMAITQLTAGARKYYYGQDTWQGLLFMNSSTKGLDYSMASFTLADMSLIRNISITPKRRNPLPYQDLAHKLNRMFTQSTPVSNLTFPQYENMFTNQHTEEWLLFTPLSTFPAAQGGIISIEFFFDYSMVQFHAPLLPYVALSNKAPARDIMRVTDTLNLDPFPLTKSSILFSPHNTRNTGKNVITKITKNLETPDDSDDDLLINHLDSK